MKDPRHAADLVFLIPLALPKQLVDRPLELLDRVIVPLFDGIYDAVLDVVLQDDPADRAQRGLHRRELDQHLRAVAVILHHSLDGIQMTGRARDSVDDLLLMRVAVRVAVRVAMPVCMFVCMAVLSGMNMGIDVTLLVDMGMRAASGKLVVKMVCHSGLLSAAEAYRLVCDFHHNRFAGGCQSSSGG